MVSKTYWKEQARLAGRTRKLNRWLLASTDILVVGNATRTATGSSNGKGHVKSAHGSVSMRWVTQRAGAAIAKIPVPVVDTGK